MKKIKEQHSFPNRNNRSSADRRNKTLCSAYDLLSTSEKKPDLRPVPTDPVPVTVDPVLADPIAPVLANSVLPVS
ncbi:hypothetical protein TNIN_327541 [Trichonephila inaurata madagascariensis]|uniref:Uncharacterized protein n=1 Tax=Trichonephila inaurata madagascariensis TaxID=2747483 RepID=A0A8X7BVD8_9ARAC|nr:hypothetical protein TNIN_327541 [Trichonephila inaurata madagascariensis]